MPDTFITDWKRIGQSGPTMDGREIEAQWLTEAAENYDLDTYTAVIWLDHWRIYGNHGKVVELKAVEEDGCVTLYAKLQPNEWLLEQNKHKQKLFTSMELTPDFAKTGKFYLTGLAVTDIPASLGTQELHFSHRKQKPDNLILCGVELDDLGSGSTSEADAPKWFVSAMKKLGIHLTYKQGATPEDPEEDTMDAKQFSELMGKLDEQGKRLSSLEEKFAAQPPEQDDEGKTVTDDGKQNFSAEITEAMKPINEKLESIQTDFTGKIDELTKRFEQASGGTIVPETDKPADYSADIA